MKAFKLLAARGYVKALGGAAAAVALVGSAHATGDPISTVLAAVDVTAVAAAVAAIALLLVGIKLTFKGPDVAARVIKKV